jgi:hypothetical protein
LPDRFCDITLDAYVVMPSFSRNSSNWRRPRWTKTAV